MQERVYVRGTLQVGGAGTYHPYVTSTYADRSMTEQWHQPWYFDSTIVGDDFAQDIATTWYRGSHFTVPMTDLGGFLRHRGFGAVTPKDVVRKIGVTIECRAHKNTTNHPRLARKLAYHLDCLAAGSTRITIDLMLLSQNNLVKRLMRDKNSKRYYRSILVDPVVWDAFKEAQKLQEMSTVPSITTAILPGLKSLAQRGHTISLLQNRCRWVREHCLDKIPARQEVKQWCAIPHTEGGVGLCRDC
jgi:hypothetical protein